MEEIETVLAKSGMADDLAMVYIETPANPTNELAEHPATMTHADADPGERAGMEILPGT